MTRYERKEISWTAIRKTKDFRCKNAPVYGIQPYHLLSPSMDLMDASSAVLLNWTSPVNAFIICSMSSTDYADQ